MGKLIKFMWLVTLLLSFGTLLYTYASMGQMINLEPDMIVKSPIHISRDVYFYVSLAILVLFNFTFYSTNMHYKRNKLNDFLKGWQLSFAAVLNLFFIVGAILIMLLNSGERFNYNTFGYLVYLTLGLVALWVLALPFVIYKGSAV